MTDSNNDEPPQKPGAEVKRNLKKSKRDKAWRPQEPRNPFTMLDSLPEEKQQEIQRALHLFSMGSALPRTLQEAQRRTYRFWDTQPVPRLDHTVTTHGPISEADSTVRPEPYTLPQGFIWDTLDPASPSVLKELCTLLSDNYTDEDDNTIRRHFSPEYMKWALQPPGWHAQWHCGVRVATNKKLVGFISAVPVDLHIYDTEKKVAQVLFLCVHKKLRLKRMAPVLIRELTRRVHQQAVHQGTFAAGVVLPTPVSTCRYWHRSLNPRKLTEVNYPGLREDLTLPRVLKLNRLPEGPRTPGLRPVRREDVPALLPLLQRHLHRFRLRPALSAREAEHWLLPREDVIDGYVVEAVDGSLTDLVTFYTVESKVMNHAVHSELKAAHLLYCVATATDLAQLMEDALALAKSKGFDIFNALDVMENSCFLEKLKFVPGATNLHYYLYNWTCPDISPSQVGFLFPN